MEFLDNTYNDAALRGWMANRFADAAGVKVIVAHVARDEATVPRRDLVNSQVRLGDGRLVRVAHVSARTAGDMRTILVLAETPATAD